jgi:hypothetical protein
VLLLLATAKDLTTLRVLPATAASITTGAGAA